MYTIPFELRKDPNVWKFDTPPCITDNQKLRKNNAVSNSWRKTALRAMSFKLPGKYKVICRLMLQDIRGLQETCSFIFGVNKMTLNVSWAWEVGMQLSQPPKSVLEVQAHWILNILEVGFWSAYIQPVRMTLVLAVMIQSGCKLEWAGQWFFPPFINPRPQFLPATEFYQLTMAASAFHTLAKVFLLWGRSHWIVSL